MIPQEQYGGMLFLFLGCDSLSAGRNSVGLYNSRTVTYI